MAYYFGWSYNNQNYYGLFYKWWAWFSALVAIALGLLLVRSLKPLAGIAMAFLRSGSSLRRALWLEGAVLILAVEWILGGGMPAFDEPLRAVYFWSLFISIYFGFLLLLGVIGLLRQGAAALARR
jgi:hypothetical protein